MRRTDGGRRTKGAIVEWVEHEKSKRKAPIRLDKTVMMFWAVTGVEASSPYFESKDGGEVKRWLRQQLAKNTEADRLDWQPVIRIEVEEADRYGYRRRSDDEERKAGFEVEIDRFFLALTKDRREWRKLGWHQCHADSPSAVPENDRYEQSSFYHRGPKHEDFQPGSSFRSYNRDEKPFMIPRRDGNVAVLAFDPALWEGLLAVIEQIEATQKTLQDMVGTKAGIAEVTKIGAKRLPLQITAKAGESNE